MMLTVEVSLRPWVVPYVNTLMWCCVLMGREPDWGKTAHLIAKYGLALNARNEDDRY